MKKILILAIFALLIGCITQQNCEHVYRVTPGRLVMVQFVETEQQVTNLYFTLQPVDSTKYQQIRGFYCEGLKTIVVAANPCDPDVLAHELMHFLGQHWVDED